MKLTKNIQTTWWFVWYTLVFPGLAFSIVEAFYELDKYNDSVVIVRFIIVFIVLAIYSSIYDRKRFRKLKKAFAWAEAIDFDSGLAYIGYEGKLRTHCSMLCKHIVAWIILYYLAISLGIKDSWYQGLFGMEVRSYVLGLFYAAGNLVVLMNCDGVIRLMREEFLIGIWEKFGEKKQSIVTGDIDSGV